MSRLHFCLALARHSGGLSGHSAVHPGSDAGALRSGEFRSGLRTPLRVWMGVLDWARGIPVGYSYWEQYEAPIMLDEIVVHHDE